MAAAKRILAFAFLAPAILQACSSDDNGPGPSDASDGGGGDGTTSDANGGGGDGTTSDAKESGAKEGGGDATPDSSPDSNLPDASDAANGSGMDAQGDGAVACPTAPYVHVSTFNAIFDGWGVANNSSPNLVPVTNVNDGAMSGTSVALDPNVGSPDPTGSAKLVIPFSQTSEQLLFAFLSGGPLNLTGERVTAQIRLDSGLSTSPVYPGSAFLALKSTIGYIYGQGNPVFLDPTAGFVTLSVDADAPTATTPGYTACDIREIDLIIQTGAVGTYASAVVHIDTIAVGPPAFDAAANSSDASTDASNGASDAADGASGAIDSASDATDGASGAIDSASDATDDASDASGGG